MMTRLRRLAGGFAALVRKRQVEEDLDAELRDFLDAAVEQKMRAGLDRDAARRAARLELGGVEAVKDRVRDVGWESAFESIWRDVRYALRGFRRTPGFTAVAALTLALGIGANSAIFTLLNAAVLRSLPVDDPARLVFLQYEYRGRPQSFFSYPHFERLHDRARTLSGLFAVADLRRVNLVAEGRAGIAAGTLVSGDYFRVLGVGPHLGRLLTPDDDRASSDAVAVIGHGFWQSRFGGDPRIVGTAIAINGIPLTIVGVTPPGFFGVTVGGASDVLMPLRLNDRLTLDRRSWWRQPFVTWLQVVGRLGPGISPDAARAELAGIFRQAHQEFAADSTDPDIRAGGATLHVESAAAGLEGRVHGFAPALRFLMAIAAIVLLVACANVANLFLARSHARQREIAIRLAIGASRSRLVRQLLTEGVLVGTIGGGLGLLLALWGSDALAKMVAIGSIPILLDPTPDLRVLAFTTLVSCSAVLLFAMAPALQATRKQRLAGFDNRAIGATRLGWNRTLVVAQITLSLVLVLAAALSLRTVGNLLGVDAGYERDDILMFSTDASLRRYTGGQVPPLYGAIQDALTTIPGVQRASMSIVRPIDTDAYLVGGVGYVDGRTLTGQSRIRYAFNVLGSGYFSTLRIPLLMGRDFGPEDSATSAKVAIINETMARAVFPGVDPLGRHFGQNEREILEVIGVVRDTKYANLVDAPRAVLYLPVSQTPWASQVTFLLRHSGTTAALADAARARLAAIDPNLPLYRVNTLDAQAQESLLRQRLLARVSSLFGGVALLVAAIGLYGLMSFAVAQRGKEIAVRMALGADPRKVVWMTVGESARLIAWGVLVGVPCAVGVMRLAKSLLFGLTPGDPLTLAGVVTVLTAVALVAAYVPARRAARVDPMIALRVD